MVTIKNIAEELNISVSTVSRAINDHPEVSFDTKQKVLKTIKRLKYTPNALARGLIQKKTFTIGLMVPDITDLYFSSIANDVEEFFSEAGYQIIYGNSSRKPEKEKKFLISSVERKIDGLIVTPDYVDRDMIEWLKQIGIPVVFLRRRPPSGLNVPFIDVDNYKGACTAMNYLYSLGHENIGFISMPEYAFAGRERQRGFLDTQNKKGVDTYQIENTEENSMEQGAMALERLVKKAPNVTAIFAASDQLAIGALERLEQRGIKVPDELSILGFGDLELSRLHWINLTTMSQPWKDLGKKAASMLLNMLKDDEYIPKSEVLDTPLIVRRSCRQIPM